jgi:predicted permease
MFSVMNRIMGFLLIIILGYFLKVTGLTKKEDSVLLGNIIVNVTLPCSFNYSFGD